VSRPSCTPPVTTTTKKNRIGRFADLIRPPQPTSSQAATLTALALATGPLKPCKLQQLSL
jgi:hypothetical protein